MGTVNAGQMVIDILLNTEEGRQTIAALETEVKKRGQSMEEAVKNLKLKFDTTPLDQTVQKSGNARMGLMQLAYGMQDASYIFVNTRMGLMGISNNLDMLIQSMVLAKAEATSMKMGLGQLLMSTLNGPTGLIVGFSLLMGVLQSLAFATDTHTNSVNAQADAMKKAKEEAENYKDALRDLAMAQLEEKEQELEAQKKAISDQLSHLQAQAPETKLSVGYGVSISGAAVEKNKEEIKSLQEALQKIETQQQAITDEVNGRLKHWTGQVGQLKIELDDVMVQLKYGNLTVAERINLLKRQSQLQKEIRDLSEGENTAQKTMTEEQRTMKDAMIDYYKTVRQEEAEMNRERRLAADLVMDQYKRQELTADQAKELLEAFKYQITDQETLNVLANDIYNIEKSEADLIKQTAKERETQLQNEMRERERQAQETERMHQEELRDLNDLITSADYLGATLEEAFSVGNSQTAKWISLLRSALQVWRTIIQIQEAANKTQETVGIINLVTTVLGAAIPFLDSGGVVTQPTLAVIGERRKEIVQPLDDYLAMASYGTTDVVMALRRVEAAVSSVQVNLVGVERLKGSDLVTGLRDVQNRKRSYAV